MTSIDLVKSKILERIGYMEKRLLEIKDLVRLLPDESKPYEPPTDDDAPELPW